MAFNPLISTIGWYLPQLFSGSLIVATVMNLPNIGPLLLRSLIKQDMYLAGSILLIYSFLTIVGTLLSDILLALIDPRIRMEGRKPCRTSAEPSAAVVPRTEERVAVASNWKLVWWRFRRHRLAVASAVVLLCFYLVVLVPGLLRDAEPGSRPTRARPSSPCRCCTSSTDGLNPWVPAVVGKRNPVTLRMEWARDEPQRRSTSRFFTRGYTYRVFGLFETNIHLIDAKTDPRPAAFPARHRPPGTRPVVAHDVRHAAPR